MTLALRTTLYVDGFNLYYGAAKNTRLKWVNVVALAEAVMPGLSVTRTRYFTAKVKSTPEDPTQAQRQQTYIRALETLPDLTVHYGHYQVSRARAKHCQPPPDTVLIYKTEEKGTDVNIATYMLAGAFRNECDRFLLMTNDSDLATPIDIINRELHKPVIVMNPHSVDTAARKTRSMGAITNLPQLPSAKGGCCRPGHSFARRSRLPHGCFTVPAYDC